MTPLAGLPVIDRRPGTFSTNILLGCGILPGISLNVNDNLLAVNPGHTTQPREISSLTTPPPTRASHFPGAAEFGSRRRILQFG